MPPVPMSSMTLYWPRLCPTTSIMPPPLACGCFGEPHVPRRFHYTSDGGKVRCGLAHTGRRGARTWDGATEPAQRLCWGRLRWRLHLGILAASPAAAAYAALLDASHWPTRETRSGCAHNGAGGDVLPATGREATRAVVASTASACG